MIVFRRKTQFTENGNLDSKSQPTFTDGTWLNV